MYDIAIIGAGPAGSTLARLVSPHLKVLLADSRLPTDASKLCGGLLAPAAQKELARQRLGVPAQVLEAPQLFAVNAVDARAGLRATYQRHYLNVDRGKFDEWLLSMVPSTCDVRRGWRLESVAPHGEASMLRFHLRTGGVASAPARLVVGADGAASCVRHLMFPGYQAPRYVSIQAEFETQDSDPLYGALFDDRITDFYGWTVPKADRLLAGCAFGPATGVMARFDRFVEVARAEGLISGCEVSRSAVPLLRPMRPKHLVLSRPGVVLLGEAAGLVSPSSAEGISYALRSASVCAGALGVGVEGAEKRYRKLATPLALEVLGKASKAHVLYGPPARRLIMSSGVGAVREGTPRLRDAIGEVLMP